MCTTGTVKERLSYNIPELLFLAVYIRVSVGTRVHKTAIVFVTGSSILSLMLMLSSNHCQTYMFAVGHVRTLPVVVKNHVLTCQSCLIAPENNLVWNRR